MAGGKGTRVSSISSILPKPMIKICGKPILEYQIECLKNNNLIDITIVVEYLYNAIIDYFGDGSRFGCKITYYIEKEPLGTAGALFKIDNLTNDFILLNGDIIFDIDFSRMINFHNEKNSLMTLVVHPNDHPFDSAILVCDNNYQVMNILNKEDERKYYKNLVNAGIHILSYELLNSISFEKEKIDLDRDIINQVIQTNRIYAYYTPEYIKDMGTPERYNQVSFDINNKIVSKKNLSNRQKCIFLDRDGTINELKGFINKPEDFILLDGVPEAIKLFNKLGFLVIVITNQPVIARGEIDIETLNLIHMKMETDLGKHGAYLDAIYYCPHHTDKGFIGERPEYKIDCDCRKPKPGMLIKAAKEFNIDLKQSYMVGDSINDVYAGISAGCHSVYLTNNTPVENFDFKDDIEIYNDLKDFSKSFCKQ